MGLLTPQERAEVLRSTRVRRFARNEVVFHEGDPGDSLHIVERGMLVARTTSALGHVLTVNAFRPGDFFGELALVSESNRRVASVVALAPSATRVLHATDVERLRRNNRAIDRLLVSVLAERNRLLTQQVTELMFTPTHKRVHRELLRLTEQDIGVDDDGWIRLGQSELATLTGTTRATVNRALQEAVERGAVELARGRSRIVDRAALERLAA